MCFPKRKSTGRHGLIMNEQNEQYDKLNVRLLSVLSYIGPLFIIGRLSVEHDEPQVSFHTAQGGILCGVIASAYLITALICLALGALPAAAEIISFLLYVGVSVAWMILAAMGIINAIKKQQRALPFIGDLGKLIQR